MPLKHTVEEVKLKNGARGLFIYTPGTTVVHYDFRFLAGFAYARSASIIEVAHVLEHMAFGPNERFSDLESFSREFSRNGARHNAFTSLLGMLYIADCALMEWDRILDLYRLVITKPKFTQQNLEAEKGNVAEELAGNASKHGRVLWQEMMKRSGMKRYHDADHLKTVNKVSLADTIDHYDRTHTLKNMKFIIAGDLRRHRHKIIQQLEGWELPTGKKLEITKDSPVTSGLVHIPRKDLPNITFIIHFFIKRNLERREMTAMSMLSHILTGTFHSRVWGEARARGICYDLWSGCEDHNGVTEFGLGGQVSKENARELMQLITEQMTEVAKRGVTEDELKAAKEYLLGSLQLGEETVRGLVSWYNSDYFDRDEIDYLGNMPDLIGGTTNQMIKSLAKEFLEGEAWSFGCIGSIPKSSAQQLYDQLAEALGKEV